MIFPVFKKCTAILLIFYCDFLTALHMTCESDYDDNYNFIVYHTIPTYLLHYNLLRL